MNALTLRILLVTTFTCSALWVVHEMAWIPYEYDLESQALEKQLSIRIEALRQQFQALPSDVWDQTVADYNRRSDDLLSLIRETDPDWADLYARVRTEGEDGLLTDGYDSIAAFVLSDERTVLHNEVFYIDSGETFDLPFWAFVLSAVILSTVMLRWVLNPFEERLRAIAIAADDFRRRHGRPRIRVRGDDLLGDVEQRINQLMGHLDHAMVDLHESIGTQRDLMHAVAHEFRGPIARLRFAIDLVSDTGNETERVELLGKMDVAIQELDDLVKEVLGYSRIRHGGYRLNIESVSLAEIMSEVLIKVRAEFPGIEFSARWPEPDESIEADRRMMDRAVINLMRNAGRFAQAQVHVDARIFDQEFEICIADDGPGVAPGKRERIFEPFTRLDASRSRESGGSGLGLAIAMAISLQHHGTIRCLDSSIGGAEFRLSWPRTHPPHTALTSE